MEVKVFYNLGMDFWRMHLSAEEINKKYKNKQRMWGLEQGMKQRRKVPLHIDSHRMFLILQTPKVVYTSAKTHHNEKIMELNIEDLKYLTTHMNDWEEYCYQKIVAKQKEQEMKPKVFFMMGAPSSGKNTICAKLA